MPSTKKLLIKGIGQRIRVVRKYLNLTQKEFAQALGFTDPTYFSKLEKEKTQPTEYLLRLIEQTFNINPKWLREGEGEMFLEERKLSEAKPLLKDNLKIIPLRMRGVWYPGQDLTQYDKEDWVVVPVYYEVDAGKVERNHTSVEPLDWVPMQVGWLTQHCFPIRVVGDSMEPTISDGSTVLIDPTQKQIVDGKIYAIEIPYIGASIKRVFIKYPNVVIKGDNPSYEPQVLPLEKLQSNDLRIIGRVIRVVELRSL